MYEEFTMDKKPIRSNQPQGKCLVSENKKSQDASSKPFPKSSRSWWERPANFNSKYDQQNRRPLPKKNKVLDKRPKPRGQYQSSGKEDSEVNEESVSAELGSVFKQGSKKQNKDLTQMLNFEFAPRERASTFSGKGSHRNTYKKKKTKEEFLHANYQFVVKSGSDLRSYESDPDRLVEWNIVEQIRIPSRDELGCPICLSSAKAAQVTRCGHVYCWSCILHHLALCENNAGPCPICFEYIKSSELKGVVRVPSLSSPTDGDIIVFNLMRREKNSLTPIPFDACNQPLPPPSSNKTWPNINDLSGAIKYSKILLAYPEQVVKLNEQLRIELKKQLEDEEKGSSEIFYIEIALQQLNEKESIQQTIISQNEIKIKPNDEECDFSSKHLGEMDLNKETPSEKLYFFYQSAGGELIFLDGLNVSMLMKAHDSLNNGPARFEAKCIDRETLSVTLDFRKRHKNLSHLPIGCQLEMVLVDLKPPIISTDIELEYQNSLKQRSLQKKRKQQEEQRRFDRNERRNLRIVPPPKLDSSIEFPQWGFDPSELPPLPKGPEIEAPSTSSSSNSETLMNIGNKGEDTSPGLSFAQMLQQGHGFSKQVKSEKEQHKIKEQVPENTTTPLSPPSRVLTMNDALMIAIERKRDDESINGGKKNKNKKKQTISLTSKMAYK